MRNHISSYSVERKAMGVIQNENLMRVIKNMYKFLTRFYSDLRAGKFFEQYSEEEFPLPELMKYTLKNCVVQFRAKEIPCFYYGIVEKELTSTEWEEKLFTFYRECFLYKQIDVNNLKFLQWAINCCIEAFRFQEIGLADTPDVAMTVIYQNCLEIEGLTSRLRSLGCNV